MGICGECGEYKSQVTIYMPVHWTAANEKRCFSVDACIASEIRKLIFLHGVRTVNCCCRPGKLDGCVLVQDDTKTRHTMQQLGYIEHPHIVSGALNFLIPQERIKHIGPSNKTD